MKKILCFGSFNIDVVLSVKDFVVAGETIAANKMEIYPGGKGLNQCVAVARAGGKAYMAGAIGKDGRFFLDLLAKENIASEFVKESLKSTGSAYIQVNSQGENCIVIARNANFDIDTDYIDSVLENFSNGDMIILQNEISCLDYIIEKAHQRGMYICLNPSPFNEMIEACNLERVNLLIVNEIEASCISQKEEIEDIIEYFRASFKDREVVITLGKKGSIYINNEEIIRQNIFIPCKVVDTTAAGDTFTGYFVASVASGINVREALKMSAKAAAMAISKNGAVESIPCVEDVLNDQSIQQG